MQFLAFILDYQAFTVARPQFVFRGNVTNWQQFEAGAEKLKELVDAIKAYRGPDRIGLTYGYIISTPGGDQVGVMYAIRLPRTYRQIGLRDGNLIAVSPHLKLEIR